ncbi:Aspartate-semialdehyde dehydrogenase [Buchnera aphidicola (Neophyllaphis podocarpi)]|uniref:aspartate-semialdehyde dehydrogenase n=1 Tax=Buchnera aphidicola TaxID=9 RepID=UPI003464B15C
MMKSVGFIGWRGMVGSVLLDRMKEEKDFNNIIPIFFSTSQIGSTVPNINSSFINKVLYDAFDISLLREQDIILTCQGTNYTKKIYDKLRSSGWEGYWIDSSSYLRTRNDSCIVLDPVNYDLIINKINEGFKTFVGGNCTVSLMLLALGGLFNDKLIEWISVATYQAASGAGSKHMFELLKQMNFLSKYIDLDLKNDLSSNILSIDRKVTNLINSDRLPKNNFKVPLVGSLIPWIDKTFSYGISKEEWKGQFETNKILGIDNENLFLIDGICVRISTLRCHSQYFTIKLKHDIHINDIIQIIYNHNKWVKIIPNDSESTISKLNPSVTSGTLDIPIGRIRKLNIGKKYLSAFTVGDQLLWGAAEPIRRMLNILIKQ